MPADNGVLAALMFEGLAQGGAALRWEPLFFDWFGGLASAPRALRGPRAPLYDTENFRAFRTGLEAFEAQDEARLQRPYFARAEPQEMLIDEVEAIWAAIAERDDWAPFNTKLSGVAEAREAMGLTP